MCAEIDRKTIEHQLEKNIALIAKHPFIYKANRKNISKQQIIRWLMCAGRESKSFPEIIKNILTWTNNEEIKIILSDNLHDEDGRGIPEQAHFNHYISLLNQMNISKKKFTSYKERVGIKLALLLAYNISMSKNTGLAMGYMLINEALTPLIYQAVKASLQELEPDLKTDFFDVHINVDKHHVDQLIKAIDHLKSIELDTIVFGIELGGRGMSVLLDEVTGVFDHLDTPEATFLNTK